MFTQVEKNTLHHILTWSDEEIADWVGDDLAELLKEKIAKVTRRLNHKKATVYTNQSWQHLLHSQEPIT